MPLIFEEDEEKVDDGPQIAVEILLDTCMIQ